MANPNSLDLRMAVAALDAAADRAQIFGQVLRGARTCVPYVALVSVHAAGLRGQAAVADDRFDRTIINGIRLPRNSVPAFEEVITTRFPYVGAIATGDPGIDVQLRNLGGSVPSTAMVLPLVVHGRTMVLVVGHAGEGPVSMDEVSNLFPLLNASGRALERFAAARSHAAAPQPGATPTATAVLDVPNEASALRGLVAQHRDRQDWSGLSDALRSLIRLGIESGDPNEAEQLELLLELGGVENYLGRVELAIEAWRSALTIDAGDRRVLDALERLFATRGLWSEFVELLERRAAVVEDPAERVGLLLNAAAFCRERLADEGRAVEAYERIVAAQPEHPVAVARLEELYRERAQWPELAALLVDQAGRQEDMRLRVAALEEAAEIYEQRMEDAGAAFLVWIVIIRLEPERTGLIDSLERLGAPAAAWDDLLPECEGLAEELEGEHRATAARLWQQIGRWYRDHLSNPDAAAGALDKAHRLGADDLVIARELMELRRTVGPPQELARLLAASVQHEGDRAARAALLIELAEVEETRLDQPDEAIVHLERALDEDASSGAAATALRRLHRARSDWEALASVLARHVEAVPVEVPRAEVAELHRELGDVLAGHLARPEKAARAFKTAIELDPTNTGAFQGLKQIHVSSGHREAYLEIEETEIAAAATPDPSRYAGVAEEWEAREAFDRAAAVWRKLLEVDRKNLVAHEGLARVLRRLGRWDALGAACRAHLKALPRGPERVPVLLDLSSALEAGLDDIDGAIKACEDVLVLVPDHAAAQDALSRLYERQGRVNDALAALERRVVAGSASDKERADLHQRIGHLQANRGDTTAAIASFEQSIALDTRNAGAHEGLGRVHRNREEWPLATVHLMRAAQLATGVDSIRCLMEAADIYWQRLDDAERARECLERALAADRNNERVRGVLCAILSDAGKWEALWPHLSEMANRATLSDATPEARRDIYLRAARCAVEIGKSPRALELLDLAHDLAPGDVHVLLARGDALYRSESWEAAAKAYNTVLVQDGGTLDRGQVGGVYRRLALINKQLGREAQATAFYKKVLELDPKNRQTLEELVDLDVSRQRYDEAIATLRTMTAMVPPAERAAIHERIGDLYADKVNNTVRASAAFEQVLEQDPRNHRVLQKLLDVQSAAGQWKDALVTIGRFIEMEAQPQRRGLYHMAAAAIRRSQLQDAAGALDDYDRALDALVADGGSVLAPAWRARALEALAEVSELVAARNDWKRQERAYRKLIKRLPMEDPILIELWQGLGEIYRTRMDDPESAIVAFETAHALDPVKQPDRIKVIAELYAQVGSSAEQDMVERASRLVESDPSNPDAFRALARACIDAGRIDEAWCVCRALVFLDKAQPAEEELFRKHLDRARRAAEGTLDHDSWRWLRDADESRTISAIFSIIWEAPVALRAGPPKSFGLKDRDKLKPDNGSRQLAKVVEGAARVLGAPLPSVYVQPDRSGKLLLANCIESKRLVPSLIVGRDLTGHRDPEVVFSVASTVALLRPAYYLRLALPTIDELEAALAAAATAVGKQLSVRPEPAAAAVAFTPEITRRLTPQAHEVLAGLVGRLPDKPDLAAWRNAVDAAGRRAGLLLSGDLAAAAAMISAEPAVVGGPRTADKIRDLVAYSVSADHFSARRHIGVHVG